MAAHDNPRDVAVEVNKLIERGEVESALRLVADNSSLWLAGGDLVGGAAVAAAALDAPGAAGIHPWRARVLYADGLLAFRSGDMRRSKERNDECLSVAVATGDARGECDALTGLARVALRNGVYRDVVALARQARERARSAGDEAAEASPLHLQAAGVRMLRDYAAARDLYLESLALNEKEGNARRVAMEQHNLGWVELHLDDVDAAEKWFRKRDAESGADAYGDAWSHLNWAAVAAARGDWGEARRRFDRGARALDAVGATLDPDDAYERAWLEDQMAKQTC